MRLIGVVMAPNQSPYLLLPYCSHGDLRTYLRNPQNLVVVADLVRFGKAVAEGKLIISNI